MCFPSVNPCLYVGFTRHQNACTGSAWSWVQVSRSNGACPTARGPFSHGLQAARGMEYLHGQYVVHFDLKCDNLLCDLRDPQRPVIKIGDLGLSKVGGEGRGGVGSGTGRDE